MKRINTMVSDESKAILVQYQVEMNFRKQDDALDALIKRFGKFWESVP